MSTVLGTVASGGLLYGLINSYRLAGAIPKSFGVAAFLALIMTMIGLILGITSLKDHDRFLIFSHLGIFLCAVALLINALVMYVGLAS